MSLNFENVMITPAVLARWQAEVLAAEKVLRSTGRTPDRKNETLREVEGGRLLMSVEIAPAFVVTCYAESGEWQYGNAEAN